MSVDTHALSDHKIGLRSKREARCFLVKTRFLSNKIIAIDSYQCHSISNVLVKVKRYLDSHLLKSQVIIFFRAAFPDVATRFVLPLSSSTRAQTGRSIRAVALE